MALADTHNLDELLARFGQRAPSLGSMILGGRRVPVPGDVVLTYLDGGCAREATDRTSRTHPPINITLHSTSGQPRDPPVSSAKATSSNACALSQYAATSSRDVSWTFTSSTQGLIVQQLDPLRFADWGSQQLNLNTLSIEVEQGAGGAIYKASLQALVRLVDALTRELGIQRQVPAVMVNGRRVPDRRVLSRFLSPQNGRDWWGLLGHRNLCDCRGSGDPGDAVVQSFLDAGYLGFDLATGEDLRAWAAIQQRLGVPADGVPGRTTREALQRAGFKWGQAIRRPGD